MVTIEDIMNSGLGLNAYISLLYVDANSQYVAPEDQYRVNENLKKIIVGPDNASE